MSTSVPGADRPRRDRTIAVNSYTTVLGRASMSEEVFRAYWRDVHGPLCSRVPGCGLYVQYHFAREHDDHLWRRPDGIGALPGYRLDGAVEIGWTSVEMQDRFQHESHILFSDEQNVFAETVAYALPSGSTTVLDREDDPAPNGPDRYDRLHVHFAARPDTAGALAAFVTDELARVAAASPEVVTVRVHVPDPHDNSTPNPPAPNVEHTVAPERVTLVVLEIAFHDALARRRFSASDAYAGTLDRQAELAASITAFAVSGVHTFVRDRELTTAGLRGSRVAELIRDAAALNQVSAEVRTLMLTGRPVEQG